MNSSTPAGNTPDDPDGEFISDSVAGAIRDPDVPPFLPRKPIDFSSAGYDDIRRIRRARLAAILESLSLRCDLLERKVSGGADLMVISRYGDTAEIRIATRPMFLRRLGVRGLWIAYPFDSERKWCVYPHDWCLRSALRKGSIQATRSWGRDGTYHFPNPPEWLISILRRFNLTDVHQS